jgi:hypothetical protein
LKGLCGIEEMMSYEAGVFKLNSDDEIAQAFLK